MNVGTAGGGAVDHRRLVEQAVALVLGEAPPGWTRLNIAFDAASSEVTAVADGGADGGAVPLAVPSQAVEALSEYHREAVSSGSLWRRLSIDCGSDGTLSMRKDAATPGVSRRWPQRVLAAITLACLVAAAVVFAVGWRRSEPPRIGVLAVPPPPRAKAAFAVLEQWYAAEDQGDAALMRQLACAHPTQSLVDWIKHDRVLRAGPGPDLSRCVDPIPRQRFDCLGESGGADQADRRPDEARSRGGADPRRLLLRDRDTRRRRRRAQGVRWTALNRIGPGTGRESCCGSALSRPYPRSRCWWSRSSVETLATGRRCGLERSATR